MPFYNTNRTDGNELLDRINRAKTQADRVLAFFYAHPGRNLTPFDVQRECLPHVPITSVRRAICDLTVAGYLVKTELRAEGDFGAKNFTWRAVVESRRHEQQTLF